MPRTVSAYALPELASPAVLAGSAVVIIDLLRASTTISAALDHDATEIVPVETPEEALALRQPDDLLGGERGGLLIPGFDLANSPRDYTRDRVSGKRIIFTTTNGTRALYYALTANAGTIAIGALVNLSAVATYIATLDLPIHLICAGTGGKVSMDDCLAAGAFLERLTDSMTPSPRILAGDDQGLLMLKLWRAESSSAGRTIDAISSSRGGRGLVRLGLEADIPYCASIDSCSVVPILDARTRSLKLATSTNP